MVSLENFDDAFDIGVNNVKAMVSSGPKSDIVNLCKTKADKNNKYPATLGVASFVPILDRNMEAIHSIHDAIEITVPVPNESYDPNDPNSKRAYWTTFVYIPESNYKVPLTDEEKKANDALKQAMYDYNDAYGRYELRGKPLYFMKAFLIRIKSDSAGPIYTDYTEPVILRHTSMAFPDAYQNTVKDMDDNMGSKEWRRKVYLPDGDVHDFMTCTTRPKPNGAIGYNVSCAIINGANSGKSVSREKLKEWMDYDIYSIGLDTTHFDLHGVKYAADNIYAALDYMDSQSGADEEPINGMVQQTADSVVPSQQNVAQPQTEAVQQNMAPSQPAPSFDTMPNVGAPIPPSSGMDF